MFQTTMKSFLMHSVGDITDITASDKVYNPDERALTLTYGPAIHSHLWCLVHFIYRYGRVTFTKGTVMPVD